MSTNFQKTYHVYMLECADKSIYVGVTSFLEQRISEHDTGKDPGSWTFTRRPLRFMWAQDFGQIQDALAAEKQLKGWTRAKKIALANREFGKLKALSNPRVENPD